jgi:hypothetical protein
MGRQNKDKRQVTSRSENKELRRVKERRKKEMWKK